MERSQVAALKSYLKKNAKKVPYRHELCEAWTVDHDEQVWLLASNSYTVAMIRMPDETPLGLSVDVERLEAWLEVNRKASSMLEVSDVLESSEVDRPNVLVSVTKYVYSDAELGSLTVDPKLLLDLRKIIARKSEDGLTLTFSGKLTPAKATIPYYLGANPNHGYIMPIRVD